MISNSGNSTRHFSCLYSEGEAIKPIYHVKLVAKYAFLLRAPRHIKNRLAGFGVDSRTGARGAGVPWLQQRSVSSLFWNTLYMRYSPGEHPDGTREDQETNTATKLLITFT